MALTLPIGKSPPMPQAYSRTAQRVTTSQVSQQQIEQQQRIEGQQQVREIDRRIAEYEKQFKEASYSRDDETASRADAFKRGLEQVRDYAKTGKYDFKELLNMAKEIAGAEISGEQARRAVYEKNKYEAVREAQLKKQEQPKATESKKSLAQFGYSRINRFTGKAEYVLPTGQVIPVNKETTQAIQEGKSLGEIFSLVPTPKKEPTFNTDSYISAVKKPTEDEIRESRRLEVAYSFNKASNYIWGLPSKAMAWTGLGGVASAKDEVVMALAGYKSGAIPEETDINRKPEPAYYTRPIITDKRIDVGSLYVSGNKEGFELVKSSWGLGLNAQAKADALANKIVEQESNLAKNEMQGIQRKVEARVNSGELTSSEANNILEMEARRIEEEHTSKARKNLDKEIKNIEELTKKEQEELIRKYKKSIAPSLVQQGVYYGLNMASYSLPVVGGGLFYLDTASFVADIPNIETSFKANPKETIKEMATGFGFMAVTGKVTKGFINKAKADKIKAENLANARKMKLIPALTIDVEKAVKVGETAQGENIYRVKVLGVSSVKDRSGKVLDSSKTLSFLKVTATNEGNAVKSVVNGISFNLRRGGIRRYKEGNKITIKTGLAEVKKGTFYFQESKIDKLFTGYGKFDFKTGTSRIKIQKGVSVKFNLEKQGRFSGLANILSKFREEYKEVKEVKTPNKNIKVKVAGKEELFENLIRTDVYTNLVKVKGYKVQRLRAGFPMRLERFKVKPQVRKPAREVKAMKDFARDFSKVFSPNAEVEASLVDIAGKELKQVKKVKEKRAVELSAKAVAQALTKVSQNTAIKDIRGRVRKTPKLETTGKTKSIISSLLGLKQGEQLKRETKIEVKQKSKDILGNFILQSQKLITQNANRTKQEQKPMVRQNQMQELQQLQLQKQKQVAIVPIFSLPSIPIRPKVKPPKIRTPVPIIPNFKKQKRNLLIDFKIKKKAKKGKRAYQSSVGAWSLGITAPIKKIKGIRITGLELRPMIATKNKKKDFGGFLI